MRQHGRQIDQARCLVDGRGLHGCDLVLPKRLAHDVKATRQWRIAKGAFPFAWLPVAIVAVSDFSGLMSSACAFARAEASAATESLDRCMARLALQEIEAHCSG